ncbi:MAG: hypothetical protein JNJ83_08070 [Verrucomicrobiaceae bacterium]|nr:hypothetical protein [Verrucomicrobiaceae bacterium]
MKTPFRSLALLLAMSGSVLLADDVEDAIQAALTAYKAGKAVEAGDLLKKAGDLIDEKTGNSLSAVLPDMIGDFKGGRITTKDLDGVGGGKATERNYRKGDKEDPKSITASVSVIANSPTLNQISTFLANPALGALLGAKPKSVGGNTAMFIGKEGLLQMSVGGKFLVTVRGKKCSEDQLAQLAGGVNLDMLAKLAK